MWNLGKEQHLWGPSFAITCLEPLLRELFVQGLRYPYFKPRYSIFFQLVSLTGFAECRRPNILHFKRTPTLFASLVISSLDYKEHQNFWVVRAFRFCFFLHFGACKLLGISHLKGVIASESMILSTNVSVDFKVIRIHCPNGFHKSCKGASFFGNIFVTWKFKSSCYKWCAVVSDRKKIWVHS